MRANETVHVHAASHPLREIAAQDVRGRATEEEASMLRDTANLKEWRNALKELKMDLEAQFMERNARAQSYQQECFQRGPAGKSDWFAFKAGYEKWRARTRRMLGGIQNRLNENRLLLEKAEEDSVVPDLRAQVGRLKRQLRKAVDFMGDDSHITFRAQDARDGLLRDFIRELEG